MYPRPKRSISIYLSAFVLAFALAPSSAWALTESVPVVGGDLTRTAFGPGTGVIVGIVDSGINFANPALGGLDSQGNPRLVAEANFVTTEPTNTGQDVFGHGTAVSGIIGSSDPIQTGYAPDVRFVDARVLDSSNAFNSDAQVINGFGFAVANNVAIINASLNYSSFGGDGSSPLSLMADYIVDTLGIPVVVSAGNNGGNPVTTSQGPGDAFNVFSVAATSRASDYSQTTTFSAYGVEPDGTVRPNISAPGDQIVTTDKSGSGFSTWSGTSFAAPAVTGMLSTQIEYGRTNSLSTDPRVLRATMLNSAEKIANRTGGAWQPAAASMVNGVYTITQALDSDSGAGQIDGSQLITQYEAGQHSAGSVPQTGWDLSTITHPTGSADYTIAEPLVAGENLSATLTWDRHVTWTDENDNGIIDSDDDFEQTNPLSNLNLDLFLNGTLIADSVSTVDNIEQINWNITQPGTYDLRVVRLAVAQASTQETYALAWMTTAVPEPTSAALCLIGLLALTITRRMPHRSR